MNELRRYVQPGPLYEDDSAEFNFDGNPVRLIAYYLPQFHPIPENDKWWGKGFTEWTQVTKSFPVFRGHYQPHLPGELGFYDLRNPETLYRQAALARRYGLAGFCIHHYWFHGKTLLEEPLRVLLENPDIDIGFCLNWANETWSRRWDASAEDVLIAQDYSPEDDIALATSLEKALADRRYIRVNGRPLIMIYRAGLLPNPKATVDRWRNHFVRAGYGDPYLVLPQTRGDIDPTPFGMDAAAGFPPHQSGFGGRRRLLGWLVKLLNPSYHGLVLSYDRMMRRALMYNNPSFYLYNSSKFTLMPGVCPGFDNHSRRGTRGLVFHGATPGKYGKWLKAACEHAMEQNLPDEKIVFVNAWNEWAEGAHLEPDRYYGYAFLAETGRVLSALATKASRSQLALTGR